MTQAVLIIFCIIATVIRTTEQLTCGPNEDLMECPAKCLSDYCPKHAGEDGRCEKPKVCGKPECKCGFNMRRAENGTCISTRDCPPFPCTAPNTEFVSCPPYCPTDDCSQATPDGRSPLPGYILIVVVVECSPQCRCIKGYWKNNGTCVPYSECPCDTETCSTKVATAVSVKHSSTAVTTKGKVKRQKKKKDEPKPTCDDNEILDDCPSNCISDHCPKCEEDNKRCEKPNPCPPPACKCRFNYRRAENGTCIPTVDCPPFDCSAKPNEQYTPCPPVCPSDSCGWPRIRGKCPFRIGILLKCNPKCQCKDGFGRLKNGTCVPFEECPNICPVNEEYHSCTQATCRQQNCNTRNDPVSCPRLDTDFCEKGCVCKENYYRNKNGKCVPEEQCNDEPKPTCDDNEILDDCPSNFVSDHCPKCEEDNKRCEKPNACPPPACKCRFNYRRAENGTCIPTVDCPPFDCSAKPNEEYTPCPPVCPSDSCGWPRIRGKCPFRIGILLKCNPKCQCKDGFGRLKNGTCVPFEECPNICPVNEEYHSCTQATCRQQNCNTRNDPVSCPRLDTDFCEKGCVCKENYYRNKNGKCVPEEQCNDEPKPTCNDNEILDDCPSNCVSDHCPKCEEDNKRCEKPNPYPPPACKCRFNYRRAENATCIPTVDCPPFDCNAKPNEQYTPCPPICPSDSCGWPRIKGKCPFKIGTILECEPKCQCKDGYGRLENGTCVPFEECLNLCPNPNEEYKKSVIPNCPLFGTCISIVARLTCDKPEVASCICKSGYLRLNETSPCIPTCDCPQMKNAPQCQTDCS